VYERKHCFFVPFFFRSLSLSFFLWSLRGRACVGSMRKVVCVVCRGVRVLPVSCVFFFCFLLSNFKKFFSMIFHSRHTEAHREKNLHLSRRVFSQTQSSNTISQRRVTEKARYVTPLFDDTREVQQQILSIKSTSSTSARYKKEKQFLSNIKR
jgi:hypothetical protein